MPIFTSVVDNAVELATKAQAHLSPRKTAVKTERLSGQASSALDGSAYEKYSEGAQRGFLSSTTPDAMGVNHRVGAIVDPNSFDWNYHLELHDDWEQQLEMARYRYNQGLLDEIPVLTGKTDEDGYLNFDDLSSEQAAHLKVLSENGIRQTPIAFASSEGKLFTRDSIMPTRIIDGGSINDIRYLTEHKQAEATRGVTVENLYDTPYENLDDTLDVLLDPDVVANHLGAGGGQGPVGLISAYDNIPTPTAWRQRVMSGEEFHAERNLEALKKIILGHRAQAIKVDNVTMQNFGDDILEMLDEGLEPTLTRKHYDPDTEFPDAPIILYRVDTSPVSAKTGKTVAESAPLETGVHYGDGAVRNHFDNQGSVNNLNERAVDVKESIAKTKADVGEVSSVIMRYIKSVTKDPADLTAEGGHVDLKQTKLPTDVDGLAGELVKAGMTEPEAKSIAGVFTRLYNAQAGQIETAVVPIARRPYLSYDNFGFEPGKIAHEMMGKSEFAQQRGRLEEISNEFINRGDVIESSPEYQGIVDELWDMIESAGYDPAMLYVNTAEPASVAGAQGGAMSMIIRAGREADVTVPLYRDTQTGASKFRNGQWANSILGIPAGAALTTIADIDASIASEPSPQVKKDRQTLEIAKSLKTKWELSPDQDILEVYQGQADKPGTLTVGIGHKVLPEDNLKLGDRVTQEQVDEWFNKDTSEAIQSARRFAGGKWDELTAQQQAALVSLSFNAGDLSKVAPTAKRALASGDIELMKQHLFSRDNGIVNANGKFVDGLFKRRQDELKTWNTKNKKE